jgi:hypothetical protein
MEIVRNGDGFLITSGHDKPGATFKEGALQVPSLMGVLTLTYIRSSNTIVAPGFLGQSEYQRAE